jgi:Mg2+-importing ATPase
MGRQGPIADCFWDRPLQELLTLLQATPVGLSSDEAARRLRQYGANSFAQESRFAGLLRSYQASVPD